MLSDPVKGYAEAAIESARTAGHGERVVEELAAFSWAVIENDNLRAALRDPALAPSVRLGIAADLLDDRAAPETAATIRFILRVTPAAEVTSTLGDVAKFARLPRGMVPAGRVRERMRGYAERVFEELTDPAALDAVEDDLFALARAVEKSVELRDAFADDDPERRVGIARDLFASKVQPATMRIITETFMSGRIRNLAGLFDWLVRIVAEERNRRVAEVRSAVELDSSERDRLGASLARLTGRNVEVRVIEDDTVLGGVLIAVGDFMIDATVRLRLERLRDALGATA
jgi:F-type H+-transporting ATPase subunit delta